MKRIGYMNTHQSEPDHEFERIKDILDWHEGFKS